MLPTAGTGCKYLRPTCTQTVQETEHRDRECRLHNSDRLTAFNHIAVKGHCRHWRSAECGFLSPAGSIAVQNLPHVKRVMQSSVEAFSRLGHKIIKGQTRVMWINIGGTAWFRENLSLEFLERVTKVSLASSKELSRYAIDSSRCFALER
jgi:hypothetical protein